MTDTRARHLPSALPPTPAELEEWNSLSREEQIARYREVLDDPETLEPGDMSFEDILRAVLEDGAVGRA